MINYLKGCQKSTQIGMLPDIINHNNEAIKNEFNWIFDSSLNRLTKSVYVPTGSVKAHFGEFVNLSCEYVTIKNVDSLKNSIYTAVEEIISDSKNHKNLKNRFSSEEAEAAYGDFFAHDADYIAFGATTVGEEFVNVNSKIDNKQDKLVDGVNIKTINNISLLGNGNIDIDTLDKGIITAGDDLNNYSTSGVYRCTGDSKDEIDNLPPDMQYSYGQLLVINGQSNDNEYVTQIFSVDGDDNNDIWYRKFGVYDPQYGESWSTWTKFAVSNSDDIIIKNYEVLPKATAEYSNIIARCNHKLYDIDIKEGWDFSPIDFCQKYPNLVSTSALYQLHEWAINTLSIPATAISQTFFSGSNRLTTKNMLNRGLQIGDTSFEGALKMKLTKRTLNLSEEFEGENFEFSKLFLTFEQYDAEASNVIVSIGNTYKKAQEEYGEITYEEIYEEVDSKTIAFVKDTEERKRVTANFDVSAIKNCNTLIISTKQQNPTDVCDVILAELEFENLQYSVNPTAEPIIINSRIKWVPISGDSSTIEYKAGPGIEIKDNTISNTLVDTVITKQDGQAISEAIYKIKESVGLDDNLNLDGETDSILTRVNDTEQCVAAGFNKLREELGLNTNLEYDSSTGNSMAEDVNKLNNDTKVATDDIHELNDANQVVADSFYKVEQKTGLTPSLDLPENFDYASLVAAINDLKERIKQLEQK